jgi:BlaI family transcriptional regulator, penicillinase repressor
MAVKPTESELSILRILWKSGDSTVRDVNADLNLIRKVGYTNTLKMMQLMHEKGLLSRDETNRSHIYSPIIQADDIRSNLLNHMIETVFEGSTSRMMVHALGNYKASPEEIEEIRSLLNNIEDDADIF